MKIGIIGAMTEEIDLLKEDMEDKVCDQIGGREYCSGNLYGLDATVVFSRWGKVASAIAATTLIIKYKIDCLIFTGVSGAIEPELNIGDIVVADKLYQHDMDARPLFNKFQIPLTDTIFFKTDSELSSQMTQAAQVFCQQGIKTAIAPEILEEFSIKTPTCYTGIIGSGDRFIASKTQKDAIGQDMPGLLAIEMEGAAIAQVCEEYAIPFTVVRIISDTANDNAAIDFSRFVSKAAKYYSRALVKEVFISIALPKPLKDNTSFLLHPGEIAIA